MARDLDRIFDNIKEVYLDDFEEAFSNGDWDSANEAFGWMEKDLKEAKGEMKRFSKRLREAEELVDDADNGLGRM